MEKISKYLKETYLEARELEFILAELKTIDFTYFIFLSYFYFLLYLFFYLKLRIRVSMTLYLNITRLSHSHMTHKKLEKVLE